MPTFNAEGALEAGYTPDQVIQQLASDPSTKFNFAAAQKAGYTASQALSQYLQGPPKPTTDNPWNALRNGAGDLVSGLGNLGKTEGQLIAKGNSGAGLAMGEAITNAGQDVVDAGNDISGPTQYVGHSIGRAYNAFKNGHIGSGLYALAGGAANALPYAAVAAGGDALGAFVGMPYAGSALAAASSAGDTVQGRMASQDQLLPTLGDLGAGVVSGVTNMALGPLAHGVAGGLAGKAAGRLAGSVVNKLAPAAAKPYANLAAAAAGKAALGIGAGAVNGAANYAENTLDTGQFTGAGLGDAAVEGAGTGGIMGGLTGGYAGLKGARQVAKTNGTAATYGAEALMAHPWNQAVSSNFQKIQAQNPTMPFQDAQAAALDQARSSGLTPPLTQDYSPEAQNVARRITLQNLFNDQKVNATTNMGVPASEAKSITDAQIMQGVADGLKNKLQGIPADLVASGQLNADQGGIINTAINEAAKRNRVAGQSVSADGEANAASGGEPYSPQSMATALDQVKQLPLPPEMLSTLLHYIPTLDMAQNNALVKNQVGPWGSRLSALRTGAAHLAPILGLSGAGGAVGHLVGEPALGTSIGTSIGTALSAYGMPVLTRALNGKPMAPIMQTAPALAAYLARNGLSPATVIPGSLTGMARDASIAAQDQRDQAAAAAQAAGSAVAKGQAQANTKLANTLGTLGPDHPVGMAAMQQLADNGAHPLIAQALAKFNGTQPLTSAQAAMTDAQQRITAQQALTALQNKQAAAGNVQAIKDQATLAKLQGRIGKSNALAAFDPDDAATAQAAGPPRAPQVGVAPSWGTQDPLSLMAQQARDAVAGKQSADQAINDMVQRELGNDLPPWLNTAAGTLRMPVNDAYEHLSSRMQPGSLNALMALDELPRAAYGIIMRHLGTAPSAQAPSGPSASTQVQLDANGDPIRNQAAYQGAIDASLTALRSVLDRYPELADKANMIHGQRPQADKQALLNAYVSTEKDPTEQQKLLDVLGPLTLYGARLN